MGSHVNIYNTDKHFFINYLRWSFIFVCVVLLFSFQINKPIGMDVDSITYYEIVQNAGVDYQGYSIEPVFNIALLISKAVSGNEFVILLSFYFITSVPLKIYAMYRDSEFFLLSFIAYLAFYSLLHDIIQIRVGLAAAIFLLSLKDIATKKIKSYFIKIILASCCHYSALVALPLFLLSSDKINKKTWVPLILLSIGIGFLNSLYGYYIAQLFTFIPGAIGAKLSRYMLLLNEGVHAQIDIFNYYNAVLTMLSLLTLLYTRGGGDKFKVITVKIFALSQISFYLLSFLPVLAYRVSELLGVTVIYVITFLIGFVKNKKIMIFLILLFLGLVLYFNLFIKSYIDWSYIK